nr:PREDICTED: THAP domain-containing protein 4-like [Linepithema humile]
MTGCVAPKCFNSSSKGFKMCYFPKDSKRCAEWIQNMGRTNWTPTQHSALCQVQFASTAWEQRVDGLLKLKRNAVPTQFHQPGSAQDHLSQLSITEAHEIPTTSNEIQTEIVTQNESEDCNINISSEASSDDENAFIMQQQHFINKKDADHTE